MADHRITIASGQLTASIDPLGAELLSLTDRHGGEYMTDGDPAFWSGHAPLLFPIVGALRGDRYRLDGREYTLPRHGFARRSRFELVERSDASALFRLADSAETRAAYPFAFFLEMSFALAGARLAMEARVSNSGERPLPFSFGYHPAFAWPLPGVASQAGHDLVFAEEEPEGIVRLTGEGLLGPREPSPVQGRTLPLDTALFQRDALVWDRLASRSVIYRAGECAAGLEIAFPDTPFLGLWQKPGARFLCIEPWAGLADEADFAGDLTDKRGVMLLPPGASRGFRMDVTVHPAGG